ncbi:PQQ-binding-like beta-propeller repeat protein [Streptomyces sp. NPDC021080]|uniref:protein kinase domain-containing protein n=1 Tax=Streptomyces sp. NPDC021080 TaxID=3365110 RepID=UPI0037BD73CE
MEALRSDDPRRLGRFGLLCRIGAGGFGEVFLGEEESATGRLAAIKLIRADVAESERLRPRFRSEIEAVNRAGGEGIPELLDADPAAARPWLATRYVPGPSLQRLVDDAGPLPEDTVLALGHDLAGTLADLHGSGLYHRDMKPSNVLVTRARPWIIDFSLVRLAADPSLTVTADAMGSFQYAAPEQASGLGRAQGPADVFAFAATLLFAATGHPPYSGRNQFDIRLRALTEPPDISGVPEGALLELITSCLRFTDTERPTMDEVRATLTRVADAVRIPYPPSALRVFERHREGLRALLGPSADRLDREEGGGRKQPLSRLRHEPPTAASAAVGEQWVWSCHDWIRVPPWLRGNVVLAVTAAGVLYWVDYRSGLPLRRLDLGAPVRGGMIPADDAVVVGTADGTVHHVRPAADDLVLARHRFPAPVHAVGWSGERGSGAREGGPGRLVVAAGTAVRMIDLGTGNRRWAAEDVGAVTGRLLLTGTAVVCCTDRGSVRGLRADDGKGLWEADLHAVCPAGPTALGDAVVVAAADGRVEALHRDTGRRLWGTSAGGTVHVPAVCRAGTVVLATVEGAVTALDAADGSARWTVTAADGPGPRALDVLVDGSAVCVADQGGIRLLDIADGRERRRWDLPSVSALRPVEGGLIAVGLDGAVRRMSLGGTGVPAKARAVDLHRIH